MAKAVLSAKATIFNGQKEVLVLRRSETHPHKPHCTDLPGGLIEPGEFELLGLAREVKEETDISLDANVCELFFAHASLLPSGNTLNMLMYHAYLDHTPDVTISWEHELYEWITLDELLGRHDLEFPERQAVEHALEHGLFRL